MVKKTEIVEEDEPQENTLEWQGDKFVLTCRRGKQYVFEEQPDSVITNARKSSTMIKRTRSGDTEDINIDMMYSKMIVKSCVDPILKESDFDLGKLPGSEALLLRKAMMDLYSMNSFL